MTWMESPVWLRWMVHRMSSAHSSRRSTATTTQSGTRSSVFRRNIPPLLREAYRQRPLSALPKDAALLVPPRVLSIRIVCGAGDSLVVHGLRRPEVPPVFRCIRHASSFFPVSCVCALKHTLRAHAK